MLDKILDQTRRTKNIFETFLTLKIGWGRGEKEMQEVDRKYLLNMK